MRNGNIRFKCNSCNAWFFVDKSKSIKTKKILAQHIDGTSFRSLADQNNSSSTTTYRKNLNALKLLPHCADLTRKYCNRFCGILVVDGKYVAVAPYDRKIPLLYGIDYLTHDIPTYKLLPSENYQACLSFFNSLRLLNYPLKALVCDDNSNIYTACLEVYPKAIIQICQNHLKENIRRFLSVRSDPTYKPFMAEINNLFKKKLSYGVFLNQANLIYQKYNADPKCTSVMLDIQNKLPLLLNHLKIKHTPRTTNLIECFNSHLNGRLKTIKGFKSFKHADLWLNAYLIFLFSQLYLLRIFH